MFQRIFAIFSICCFLGVGSVYAQPKNPKIRELKIEMVTGKMNLTEAQSQKFLPLYNQYSDELFAVYQAKKALRDNKNSEYVVNEMQQLDQRVVDIKGRYKERFLKIMSAQQLSQMYQAEEEFKKMLIEKLKNSN